VARPGGQAKYIKLFVGEVVNERGSLEDLAVAVGIAQCTVQIIKKGYDNVRMNLKLIKWGDLAG
jgi:hypothetical protein